MALSLALTGCTSLLFHPMQELVRTPEQVGLAYREVTLATDDGVSLHGWHLPSEQQPPIASVLLVHGNAENISTHLASVAWMPAAGVEVLLFDYRGYGQSEGEPTLEGLHNDTQAAMDKLLALADSEWIVILGQSLGGAVAISALARFPAKDRIDGLIVESAFSSYRAISREKLGEFWLTWPLQWPLSLLINNRYKPLEDIATLSPVPVLIVHGLADEVIPPHHARRLFEAAEEPKTMWLAPEVGHIRTFVYERHRERLIDYIRELDTRQETNAGGRG